jgi:hypothetical protein
MHAFFFLTFLSFLFIFVAILFTPNIHPKFMATYQCIFLFIHLQLRVCVRNIHAGISGRRVQDMQALQQNIAHMEALSWKLKRDAMNTQMSAG